MSHASIAIGSDHAGFELKERIRNHLTERGYDVRDFGPQTSTAIDYPDIAAPLAEAVVNGAHRLGIIICSNGVGVSVAANKVRGARAALCADTWTARRAREHTDCNILALGSYAVGHAIAIEIAEAFLHAEFEGGRHIRRLLKLRDIEARHLPEQIEPTTPPPVPAVQRSIPHVQHQTEAQLSPMA